MRLSSKRLLLLLGMVLGTIVMFVLLSPSGKPASLRFLGYGTDGTGLLLFSNTTGHELEFYRPEIEVRQAEVTTIYAQNYLIASHLLAPHGSIVLRVDLPQGRFAWTATVRGPEESKIRERFAALLQRFGINHESTGSEFEISVVVPELNFRSGTNVVGSPTDVWEVIRRRF